MVKFMTVFIYINKVKALDISVNKILKDRILLQEYGTFKLIMEFIAGGHL